MIKRNWKNYHTNLTLTDLLFNLLLGFICLFVLSYLLINLETKKANIETKAELVVTLTWESDNIDDVDLWMRDPDGNILFFRKKEIGLMHLDRDDLGYQNDTIVTAAGEVIQYNYNQEIGTIRGWMAGEWVINIHMYNKKDPRPCRITVRVDKLNPVVKVVRHKEFTMYSKGDEETVARIITAGDGTVLSIDEMPVQLVTQKLLHASTPTSTPQGDIEDDR